MFRFSTNGTLRKAVNVKKSSAWSITHRNIGDHKKIQQPGPCNICQYCASKLKDVSNILKPTEVRMRDIEQSAQNEPANIMQPTEVRLGIREIEQSPQNEPSEIERKFIDDRQTEHISSTIPRSAIILMSFEGIVVRSKKKMFSLKAEVKEIADESIEQLDKKSSSSIEVIDQHKATAKISESVTSESKRSNVNSVAPDQLMPQSNGAAALIAFTDKQEKTVENKRVIRNPKMSMVVTEPLLPKRSKAHAISNYIKKHLFTSQIQSKRKFSDYSCDDDVCERVPQLYIIQNNAINSTRKPALSHCPCPTDESEKDLFKEIMVCESKKSCIASGEAPSAEVVCVSEQEIYSGISKTSIYKNPEYYCYHKYSYLNSLVDIANCRLPQPTSKENKNYCQ